MGYKLGREKPYQKTLPFLKKGFFGIIIAIILTLTFATETPSEKALLTMFFGLTAALLFFAFFMWLFYTIKDSSVTKSIVETGKKTITDFLNGKSNQSK